MARGQSFQRFKIPREKNPRRVVLGQAEYDALLRVSREIDWRFHVALVLCHKTGHRARAVRNLWWSDIDLEARRVTWRAENEKSGYEHITPLTPEAHRALLYARSQTAAVGGPARASLDT